MQPAEEFMKQMFRERTEDIKRELERRTPFRQKFFADDCDWDSRKISIQRSMSEKIVQVRILGDSAEVITERAAEEFPRMRYTLKQSGVSWRIQRVDVMFAEDREWFLGNRPGQAQESHS